MGEGGTPDTWQYMGGTFTETGSWREEFQRSKVDKLGYQSDIMAALVSGDIKAVFPNERRYVTENGSVSNSSNNNWFVTDYIPVSIARSWTIKNAGYVNKSYPNVGFFDESYAPIGSFKLMSGGNSSPTTDLNLSEELLQSHPDAAFVVYASYDVDLSETSVEGGKTDTAARFTGCESRIGWLEGSVQDNSERVSALEEEMTAGPGTETIGNLLSDMTTQSGYYDTGGSLGASANWSASSFIDVEPETEYVYKKISSDTSHDYFYDGEKKCISGIAYSAIDSSALRFTTPGGCRYVRLSFNSPTPAPDRGYLCRADNIRDFLSDREQVMTGKIRLDCVLGYEMLYRKRTHNLLDVGAITHDTFLNGFMGVSSNLQGWSTTDIIQVKTGHRYVLYDAANYSVITPQYSFFGSQYGTSLGDVSQYLDDDGIFTVPESAKYVQFSIRNYSDMLVLQDAGAPRYYVPYGFEADHQDIVHSPFLGIKACIVGDSTTEGGQWMNIVAQRLGMWLHVNAIGGTTVAYDDSKGSETTSMCTDTRINAIPEDTDLVVFAGGLNDWAGPGIPLGTIDGEHVHDTFYGAYQLMLDKALARCPGARFVLAELTYRHQGVANSQGASVNDYRNAVRAIAEKYCYPLLPMYRNAGIHAGNYTQFSSTGDDPVHHNEAGNERLGRVATAAMLAMV